MAYVAECTGLETESNCEPKRASKLSVSDLSVTKANQAYHLYAKTTYIRGMHILSRLITHASRIFISSTTSNPEVASRQPENQTEPLTACRSPKRCRLL